MPLTHSFDFRLSDRRFSVPLHVIHDLLQSEITAATEAVDRSTPASTQDHQHSHHHFQPPVECGIVRSEDNPSARARVHRTSSIELLSGQNLFRMLGKLKVSHKQPLHCLVCHQP